MTEIAAHAGTSRDPSSGKGRAGGEHSLHAAFCADRAIQRRVQVVENVQIARDTFRIRFECPELARQIVPGQFVMMRLAGLDDPLLGRPLALYDTLIGNAQRAATPLREVPAPGPTGIDIVYIVLGKMTRRLVLYRAGDEIDVWGPLGNGFPPVPAEHLIMVAGGIGQTPFLALGKEYLGKGQYGDPPRRAPRARRVTLCYGVRTGELLAGVPDFQAAGFDVRVSSDDGTVGRHGLVTDVLDEVLEEAAGEDRCDGQGAGRLVVCCGPEPMMEAVAERCLVAGVRCLVSLETPMACGIGICFSCVAKVRQGNGRWDWKRTCVEGPVFDAETIVW